MEGLVSEIHALLYYDVLAWLASGMTNKDIIEDFPELNNEDILACLAYAAEREHKIRVAL